LNKCRERDSTLELGEGTSLPFTHLHAFTDASDNIPQKGMNSISEKRLPVCQHQYQPHRDIRHPVVILKMWPLSLSLREVLSWQCTSASLDCLLRSWSPFKLAEKMTSLPTWPTRSSSITAASPLVDITVAGGSNKGSACSSSRQKNIYKTRPTPRPISSSTNIQAFEEDALPKFNHNNKTKAMASGDRAPSTPRFMEGTTASVARAVRLAPSHTRPATPVLDPMKKKERFADTKEKIAETKARFGIGTSGSRKSGSVGKAFALSAISPASAHPRSQRKVSIDLEET
jgi:hypothetical protein